MVTVYEAYAAGSDTYVYRNVANGKYYRLNGLSNVALKSGETSVYTGTAISETELTVLDGYLADGSQIITNVDDLRGTVQETATFDADGKEVAADAEGAVTYNVFTATGVAVQESGTNLQESTLTLYQKEDTSSDANYYAAFYVTQADETQVLTLDATALTERAASATAPTNFYYLPDTLQESWTTETQTITIGGDSKDCEVYTDGSVTVYKYTEYTTIQVDVPVYDEYGQQTSTKKETVKIVASETYYYGTTTGEGETQTTTYTAITPFAQGLYGIIGDDKTVSGTVTPGAVKTTDVSIPTTVMTQVTGDPVTLKVAISATGATATGNVSFQITNTTTGLSTTKTASLSSSGTASLTWTPSSEGVYTIRAVYVGSDTVAAAASNTITYYATAGSDTLYDIELPAAPQYGATITPGLVKWTKDEGTENVTNVTFTYHEYVGTSGDGTDNRGYKTAGTTIPSSGISSLQPGAYLIKTNVTVGEETSTITKALTISKRAINVTLPSFDVSTDNVSGFSWADQLKTIKVTNSDGTLCTLDAAYGTAADGYSNLFSLAGNTLPATAGNYNITVGYTTNTTSAGTTLQDDFLSKYLPTFNRCVATVTTDSYTVTYTAGANGTITANNISDGSQGFNSGTMIKKNSKLLFTAVPDSGFAVSKWLIEGEEVTSDTLGVTVGTNTLTLILNALSSNLVVTVEFSNETHKVNFGTDTPTGGTVTATQYGTALVSNDTVVGGSSVTFTATPESGYVVKQWSIAKDSGAAQTQTNPDGSAYTGTTLTLDAIDAGTTVTVTFEEAGASIQVTYGAVKNENGSLVPANDVVTFTADGLTSGTAVKGSTVKLTATVTPGTAIQEWQVSMDGTNWTTVAESVKEYTIYSLQADTQIRVLVTTSSATYPVTFGIVDGNGNTVSVAGTLTAAYNGGNIDSGTSCMAYTTVVFTYTESQNYEFVRWDVTGTQGTAATDAANKKVHTYTIGSLNGGTEVNVVVQKKPQITFTQSANGTITVTGTIEGEANQTVESGKWVDRGTDITVTLEPDMGYEVSSPNSGWTAAANSDNYTYTISNMQENQDITPTWSKIPACVVTYSVVDKNGGEAGGLNGTLTASVDRKGMSDYAVTGDNDGTETVYRDSVVTFTATPAAGYKIGKWIVNGTEQSNQPELTISSASAQTVQVQFDPVGEAVTYGFDPAGATDQASLSAVYQANGSTEKDPFSSGNKPTVDGTITFTVFNLADGYEVEGWYVNGVRQDGETDKSFAYDVTTGTGVDVQVKIIRSSYTLTFSAANGTVTAKANGTAIQSGDSVVGDTAVTFTAAPAGTTGYTFAGWTVNGEPSEALTESLTLTITKDTVVKASYALDKVRYTVTHGVIGENGGKLTVTALDAENTAAAGSDVVFKAIPADGYRVKGWYSNVGGTAAIPGTAAEQNSYTLKNLLANASVYVAFEPIPTYDITVTVTGRGTVTATVNGKTAEITNNKLTVSCHDNVVLTAAPDAYQYLTGWTLDGANQGNGSMTLTLTDVTGNHTVTADFAASQLVNCQTTVVNAEGGSLTAQAGYGETLSTIDASTGISIEKGKKVVLTAVPAGNYMVKAWKVNGVAQDNLSNTLTIENLSQATVVTVEFETPVTMHAIPNPGTNAGCTISNIVKTPSDYGTAYEIRDRGTVTFTVVPEAGMYLTELTVNGTDCLTSTGTSGSENRLTIRNNGDGSFTITVANVTKNIELTSESLEFQTVQEELTEVPAELADKYQSVELLKTYLRTQVKKVDSNVSSSQIALFDIVLKYTTDGGSTWAEVDKDHFPAGGITVFFLYSDLGNTDSSYTFTVIHMFSTGDIENITPIKTETGIQFTVTSLSPFAIGWSKYTAPSGGGGGGGGTSSGSTTYAITVDSAKHGDVTSSHESASKDTTVTLTVKPETGYTLETLTVTDGSGNKVSVTEKSGEYTFTMPASKVTVKATFMEDNSMMNFFVDVPASAYYYDAVLWAAKEGITGGTTATTFSPYATCTRAQAVTFLWRAAGSPAPKSSTMPFTDVAESSYYHDAVLWAVEQGITKGTTDTTFSPNATCSRAQIVTFLWRSQKSPAAGSVNPFTDVAADAYYSSAVLWAVENGITAGTTAATFSPNVDCTRAQIVTFLYRFLG